MADIADLQIRLLQGACNSSTSCQESQVFSVTQEDLSLESNSATGSGSYAIHNLHYKLTVFIPLYEELTDGDYTYEITLYDHYNQQTKAYLSAFI